MLFSLLLTTALADQVKFDVDKGAQKWSFEVVWTDAVDKRHKAEFKLPADNIKADLDQPLRYKPKEANEFAAKAVNRWAKNRGKGPKVKATANAKGVSIAVTDAKNTKVAKKALREAVDVRDKAWKTYRDNNGFTLLDGAVVPDHAKHVRQYTDDVKPLVKALGGPTKDPRKFGNKALSFVQSIPYEKSGKKRDKYRRPLSMLGRNKGDCDSKVVLYLALMRAAYPNVDSGVVYIPGHAYAAVGLDPVVGDARLKKDGSTWLLVEPVGPAVVSMGTVGRKSRRRARRGAVDLKEV
jgi:hypothetical protein